MNYTNIKSEREGHIAVITINRPEKLNALNLDTIRELGKEFSSLNDDRNIRAVIITGSGQKAFVAGADISEFADFAVEQGKEMSASGHEMLFDRIEKMRKPVIAAVNGFALGGGLELAMACHIRIASSNAKLGLPEVSLGVIPGYGGTQRLPRLIGKGRAFEMILTGDMIDAESALREGLVNYVVDQEELMNKAKAIAARIAERSPVAIKAAIKAVNAGFTNGTNGFQKEIEAFGECFGSEDFREGTKAFLEKRKPVFPGN